MSGLVPGVYPAAVTPMTESGEVDLTSLARLLAFFEAAGCAGVVLTGTTGEGPSLSAVSKRDLIAAATRWPGRLAAILGIATPSLGEAIWLARRAADAGASGVLVMPPFFYRDRSGDEMREWFLRFLDRCPLPAILYHFPRLSGFVMTPEWLSEIATHERVAGIKDSSGEPKNLLPFRQAVGAHRLAFVGDETLLVDALEAGWSGTISGAANVLAPWLVRIVEEWPRDRESARAKFTLVEPSVRLLRASPQPATYKAVLAAAGILEGAFVLPPATPADEAARDAVSRELHRSTGWGPDRPVIPLPGETDEPAVVRMVSARDEPE